jgi:hypothetical protein
MNEESRLAGRLPDLQRSEQSVQGLQDAVQLDLIEELALYAEGFEGWEVFAEPEQSRSDDREAA